MLVCLSPAYENGAAGNSSKSVSCVVPFFSVIIPTYNCNEKLAKSVDSVLAQQESSYEILILDGESTDGTLGIVKSYALRFPEQIRWVSEKDGGIYDAMNHGIDLSRGKYLYFLGAGDVLCEDVFAQIERATPAKGMAFVYGNWISRGVLYQGEFDRARMAVYPPCHQAIFYERSLFDTFGRYEMKYRCNADWALNMRCFGSDAVQKVYVDLVITDYEGRGVSELVADRAFLRDKARLSEQFLGVRVSERPFFVIERILARRIEKATWYVPRKFWHAQLWLLHKLVRPLVQKRLGEITPPARFDQQYKVIHLDHV